MLSPAESLGSARPGGRRSEGEIVWSPDLELGIELIDEQHKCIVHCYNELHNPSHAGNRRVIGEVLAELVNYTGSHFEFEEYLLKQAKYPFVEPHHRVHGLFIRKLQRYHSRFEAGELVVDELGRMLKHWLFNHILEEDRDYVSAVGSILKDIVRAPQPGICGGLRRLLS